MTTAASYRHGVALPRLAEWAGGTVFCLATGPSLTPEDVNAVRGRGIVIAVNDAHRLAPWADVLYSSDRYWWAHYKGVPTFDGLKATIEFSPGRYAKDLTRFVPEMYFLRQTGHHGLETDPTGLRTCSLNSGGAALNLAVHLGARRVILLGYDCGMGASDKRHFFGDHPSPLSNTVSLYPNWRQGFDSMAPELLAAGVEVVNCSRSTSLNCFPVLPLEDAL